MNQNKPYVPHHINATPEDLTGNNGIGRYILLPGSDGRANEISHHFSHRTVKPHQRGHNLYLGTIECNDNTIDVAAIASGMGCPSMEIILHELYHLGGKRFLRVGTAGSLQPGMVNIGDFINAQAAVRDEHTTADYAPITVPAVASYEFTAAITHAAKELGITNLMHAGTVHCKSSLYAREFGDGPRGGKNKAYINLLMHCGVLASEMETSALFIQSQLYNYDLIRQGTGPQFRVLCGALLGIISVSPDQFVSSPQEAEIAKNLIDLALETIRSLALTECDN